MPDDLFRHWLAQRRQEKPNIYILKHNIYIKYTNINMMKIIFHANVKKTVNERRRQFMTTVTGGITQISVE